MPIFFEAFFFGIDDMIQALPNLATVHIISTLYHHPADSRAQEFEHVRRWGDISPAFNLCLLPSGTSWERLPTSNVWLPDESATEWFIKEVFGSTSLPTAYLAALEGLCGKERIKKLRAFYGPDALDGVNHGANQ
ncbi:hypothetical protein C8F04DRAFT_1255603 [Mycena alexandri]|uniref:Uncharacterized protein n=1 Tax=Mycena alexandri TaxID=1745969 RepID=A0AAD6X4G7_9AGAR|nr:hypothetical protein C8F04DRAFT_1255603 [Mycena alexandri]